MNKDAALRKENFILSLLFTCLIFISFTCAVTTTIQAQMLQILEKKVEQYCFVYPPENGTKFAKGNY